MRTARKLKKHGLDRDVVNYCKARAYVSHDGFFRYCVDVLGYKDLYEPFHRPLCRHTVNPKNRYKMIQACRGSFKSSISTIGYATWLIARETTLTGKCDIRILVASEVLALANAFCKSIRSILEYNFLYKELFGEHKGEMRGRNWTDTSLTSRFRANLTEKEPTVSALALDAPRAGFHYDIILADDLETERASATRDQIEKCWDFYRLLHSLLEPTGELVITSTRWHYDDIYSRILKEDIKELGDQNYSVLIKPAELEDGTLTFPPRFTREHLDHLKHRHGSYLYACQYLLDPVPEADRVFKKKWLEYSNPDIWSQPRLRTFIGADFAYTEQRRLDSGEIKHADYSVIITCVVDQNWNYYIKQAFRERCSKLEAIQEMNNKALVVGLQKFDRAQIDDVIVQAGYLERKRPRCEYISYPPQQSKNERIRTSLQPLFEAGKFFLLPGMDWLEEELMDFPRAAYDDGLDALCNVVKISRPPPSEKIKPKFSALAKHIMALHKGRVRHLDGSYEMDADNWKQI
jgi:phage terminase large subunit-like protein